MRKVSLIIIFVYQIRLIVNYPRFRFIYNPIQDYMQNILITGASGFIGSHVVRHFLSKYPDYTLVNLDKLTYAGNLENLRDIDQNEKYHFEKVDICDFDAVQKVLQKYEIDSIIHLAAESHVDRSISNPTEFVLTNVLGTVNLLNAAKDYWKDDLDNHIFYHVSTDEVYGTLGATGLFTEDTPYDPRSPYSASKASSDHFVRAYLHTYGMPVKLSNCSNNYGSHQFPEKLIPLFINNIKNKKSLPVYGDGKYTRDWLWVVDHARAIDDVFHKGKVGETYNIGGFNEWQNMDLIHVLIEQMDAKLGNAPGTSKELITYVKDRPGHDKRYAIDASKIEKELGWRPSVTFEEGLSKTIDWYLANEEWMENVTSGHYRKYYESMYAHR